MNHTRLVVGAWLTAALSAAWPAAAQRQRAATLAQREAVAAADSLDADEQFRLAVAYHERRRWDEEAAALRRVLAIDPRYAPAYIGLATMPYHRRPRLATEERKGKVPPQWRDSLLASYQLRRMAFLLDPLGEFRAPDLRVDPAATFFEFYLAVAAGGRPRDSLPASLLWARGMVAGRRGRYADGIADFEVLVRRGVELERDSLVRVPLNTNECRYVLAVLSERAGKPADAINLYRETITTDLSLYLAHVRIARVYRQHGMLTEAIAAARLAAETGSDDPTTLRELGEILADARRYDEAETALLQAATANPRDALMDFALGRLYVAMSKPGEARVRLSRFVATAPERHALLAEEARLLLAQLPAEGS